MCVCVTCVCVCATFMSVCVCVFQVVHGKVYIYNSSSSPEHKNNLFQMSKVQHLYELSYLIPRKA